MKRFSFSLEALLEKRKQEEEEIKLELAKKNNEIYKAKNEIIDLATQLQNLQTEQKEKRKNISDVLQLKYSVSFRNKLKLDMLRKGRDIQELYRHLANIRQRLVKATQRKKAIELMRERRYRQWHKENKHREQVFIDDVSQQGFIRKQKTAKIFSTA